MRVFESMKVDTARGFLEGVTELNRQYLIRDTQATSRTGEGCAQAGTRRKLQRNSLKYY